MIERKYVETSKGAVKYLESGQGKALFMIHGGFGNAPDLMDWAKSTFSDFRLVVPFLPGHGSFDLIQNDYQTFLQTLSEVGGKLNLKDYCLWGHSFGGRISFDLLRNQMLKPKKTILIAPLLGPIDPNVARVGLGVFRDYVQDLGLSRVSSRKEVPLSVYRRNFGNIWRTLTSLPSDNFSKCHSPLLLIWGKEDRVVPLTNNKNHVFNIHADIYKEFPGGHFNFFKNQEISLFMKDFIKDGI